jgi:hypothetical protein
VTDAEYLKKAKGLTLKKSGGKRVLSLFMLIFLSACNEIMSENEFLAIDPKPSDREPGIAKRVAEFRLSFEKTWKERCT